MIPGWLPDGAVTYLAHTAGGHADPGAGPGPGLPRLDRAAPDPPGRGVARRSADRRGAGADRPRPRRRIRRRPADCRRLQGVAVHADPGRPARRRRPTRASSARRAASCAGSARRAPSSPSRRAWRRRWCCARWCRASRTASPWSTATWRMPSRCRSGSPASKAGKIACYSITAVGRAALKRLLTEERVGRGAEGGGFAEAQAPFQEQHRFFAERTVMAEDGSGERRLRFNLAESPLSVLGRKRDKDGAAYLTADLIEAGERLREDFELAQMGPRVTQNWERFLTAGGARGAVARARAGRGAAGRAGAGRQGDGGAGAGAVGHRLPDLLLPRRARDRGEAARLVGALGQGGAEDRAGAAGGALRHRRRSRSARPADQPSCSRAAAMIAAEVGRRQRGAADQRAVDVRARRRSRRRCRA